jgi:hypothetical protein
VAVYPADTLFPNASLVPVAVVAGGFAQRMTVGDTAVALIPAGTASAPGRRMVVHNTNTSAADTLSVGGNADVTATSGFLLGADAQLVLAMSPGDDVWAVRGGTADVEVHILRLGPR